MRSIHKPSEPVEVHETPLVPFRYPVNIWDYEPVGPLFRFDLHGSYPETKLRVHETWEGLNNVIERFAAHGLPQWDDAFCWVLDSNDVVILGYGTTSGCRQQFGPWGWWIGVEAAYQVLERHHDPMEVAVWEMQAREVCW